jgi:CBS domain-containing protein
MRYETTLARDIMVTRLVTLAPATHVLDGVHQLLKHRISGAPVVDRDRNYLGVFSEKCCMEVLTRAASLVRENGNKTALRAKDFMVSRLVTVTPQSDLFESITYLLKNNISGAPVVNDDQVFLGVFSEKTVMRFVIESAYDSLPTTQVEAFMNPDLGRAIVEDTDFLEIAEKFLKTHYRRLPVLRDGKLLGQISRRDVLLAEKAFAAGAKGLETALTADGGLFGKEHLGCGQAAAVREASSAETATFMDRDARTITEETDLLSVAQIFLDTPHRRLPVVNKGKLVGQVSRRDVMRATHNLMEIPPQREKALLYLSSLMEREDAPFD